MRLRTFTLRLSRGGPSVANRGFTLPEMLITSTLLILLVGGIMIAHLFGLRMYQITESKLGATAGARRAVGRLTDEIRRSRSMLVGNVTNGVFVGLLDGETQQGNGLFIQPSTNAAEYVLYFVNPADRTFRRTTSAPNTTSVLAVAVTNDVVFQAQDFLGNVLTNKQINRVIHVSLEFYQSERFMRIADRYKLETSVTRRALESP
jgi:prepilin-type N-terminal cleavage/methylation domain-containing protein